MSRPQIRGKVMTYRADNYLAALGDSGATSQKRERYETAIGYLESHYRQPNGEPDREAVKQRLSSIDFSKPVNLREVEAGETLCQYVDPNAIDHQKLDSGGNPSLKSDNREKFVGEYFTDRGVPTEKLAVSREVDGETRQRVDLVASERVVVLECYAKDNVDTWSQRNPTLEQTKANPAKQQRYGRTQQSYDLAEKQHPTLEQSQAGQSKHVANNAKPGEYAVGGAKQYIAPKQPSPADRDSAARSAGNQSSEPRTVASKFVTKDEYAKISRGAADRSSQSRDPLKQKAADRIASQSRSKQSKSIQRKR